MSGTEETRKKTLELLIIHRKALERKITRTGQQIEEISRQIKELGG